MILPALNAARFGLNGDKPVAIKSAFTKRLNFSSLRINSLAKVVLPAPFGPASISIFGN